MPATLVVATGASRPPWRGALLGLALSVLLAGCAGLPQGPTYTDVELKAICERQGGWWRGELIKGYCEYQTASLSQAP
ncbi:MAG TPA: hypothetical protein VLK35_14440 [Methylomirabilota bacterium]|nr:hypothetical protein [Methylomirabilota bacterium]